MPEQLYNINDVRGLAGRDGGPYLDQEEAIAAEIRRAKVEGREPDLDNPPATAGTMLVNAAQAVNAIDVGGVSSRSTSSADQLVKMFERAAADKDTLLTAKSERPSPKEVEAAESADVVEEEVKPVTKTSAGDKKAY